MVSFILLLFALMDGGGGPVIETCAFLPADDPCHLPAPAPPTCIIHHGVEICT